ncbi:MAG: hypothetical protein KGP13_07305 [Burkholderiales bacterium]|nr:hypothetical protein [Burkholderiales bacterium]
MTRLSPSEEKYQIAQSLIENYSPGPNGASKTTFARDFLPAEAQTLRFING